MDLSNLQSRVNTPYIPPHRTQLHPRLYSSTSTSTQPNSKFSNNKIRLLFILASLFTIPSIYFLFTTAQKVHQSSKFAEPTVQFYGILIDSSPAAARLRVFEFLGEGKMPFVDSVKVRGDVSHSIEGLIDFAKKRVPKKEWASTKVQLIVDGTVEGRVLEDCRRALRASQFAFKDAWARVIQDGDRGTYAWLAANYALGNLGGEPQGTIGIVELGGTSLQVTFAMRDSPHLQSYRSFRFAGVTYDLYTRSLPQFGQDAAWDSLHELWNSKQFKSFSGSSKLSIDNPCIPKGYELTMNTSYRKLLTSHTMGNFTACRFEALALLKRKGNCLSQPCQILSSFFSDSQGKPVLSGNFLYTTESFGLVPSASLLELEAHGRHYCEDGWEILRSEHEGIDELDLLRYCFVSAYTTMLLHDSLGIPMHDKRIGFSSHNGSIHFDWTLGAFIYQSMLEPSESEFENQDQIVGDESLTYLLFFAVLLIAFLTAYFVRQWRKPQIKTVYDLEKGRYIMTRLPR